MKRAVRKQLLAMRTSNLCVGYLETFLKLRGGSCANIAEQGAYETRAALDDEDDADDGAFCHVWGRASSNMTMIYIYIYIYSIYRDRERERERATWQSVSDCTIVRWYAGGWLAALVTLANYAVCAGDAVYAG